MIDFSKFKTPGVYVEELSKLPPSIAPVSTAIPVFIGYTQKAQRREANDLHNLPYRITSLLQYEQFFGTTKKEPSIEVVATDNNGRLEFNSKIAAAVPYKMFYAMKAYFDNGGGPCWICSVGLIDGSDNIDHEVLKGGILHTNRVDEITLLNFPDSLSIASSANYYDLVNAGLKACHDLTDRFMVFDVWRDPANLTVEQYDDDIQELRDRTDNTEDMAKYGAAYFPRLQSNIDYEFDDKDISVKVGGVDQGKLDTLKAKDNRLYFQVKNAVRDMRHLMPCTPSVLGKYVEVDSSRGVWKAPANVNINGVIELEVKINDADQKDLNVDAVAGKSVNVIRKFTGRGNAIIWGARTLAGNSNEWRYVPVRRYFNFVEESTKNATFQFVFEPNDKNTWTRVKSMIDNFLLLQWRAGALMGKKPEEAFYVRVGLGETMTELDIWEGRMIVEIGMAVVRPAEFIILVFSHKMLSE